MKKRLFLITLTAAALVCSSLAEAYARPGKAHNHRAYKHDQQTGDYYPQQPRYPHSPVHKNVSCGVLGSVLGYEIVKDNSVATGLDAASTDTYLGKRRSEKH